MPYIKNIIIDIKVKIIGIIKGKLPINPRLKYLFGRLILTVIAL